MTLSQGDSPEQLLGRAVTGAILYRSLGVFAGPVADSLAGGPTAAGSLAARLGLHEPSLVRLLGLLASFGVVAEVSPAVFELTALGAHFTSGSRSGCAARLAPAWQDLFWQALGALPVAVRTGQPGFDVAFGSEFFAYLAANPAAGAAFSAAMARVSAPEEAAIATSYPFGDYACVVDVGGGSGGLLAAIGVSHPATQRVLYDRAAVVAAVSAPGIEVVAGDFFAVVPGGGDLYVLKRVLHDWNDEQAITILGQIRAVLTPASRLLIIEGLLGTSGAPDPLRVQDIGLLALTAGRERTAQEFARLLGAAGMRMVGSPLLVPGQSLALLEAVAD